VSHFASELRTAPVVPIRNMRLSVRNETGVLQRTAAAKVLKGPHSGPDRPAVFDASGARKQEIGRRGQAAARDILKRISFRPNHRYTPKGEIAPKMLREKTRPAPFETFLQERMDAHGVSADLYSIKLRRNWRAKAQEWPSNTDLDFVEMPDRIPIECFDQDANLVDLITGEPSNILVFRVGTITFLTWNLP
jgi:hypothetical protein